ncbi:hypothetical protein [Paenibacillus solani]|uniref:hypothetical protein n=1 Tax=Paenibacillus solani TaxID=1705565 RepID=UPI003D2B66AA
MKETLDGILRSIKDNRNKALIIELEELYITIFNQKVKMGVSDDVWGRYQLLNKAEDEAQKKTRQSRLNLSVEFEIEKNPEVWVSANEFLKSRTEEDVKRMKEYFSEK